MNAIDREILDRRLNDADAVNAITDAYDEMDKLNQELQQ